jgi:hypothetical protein
VAERPAAFSMMRGWRHLPADKSSNAELSQIMIEVLVHQDRPLAGSESADLIHTQQSLEIW